MSAQPKDRFLLWVDAVGGFLVCPQREVVVGLAVPDSAVDIPIQGDLARRHATILRDAEGYVLTPEAETRIDGRLLRGPVVLGDKSLIELGPAVKLRFRRPHPLSATARLEPASHHRTRPAVDGVLLLAESCVLGPSPMSHVVARHWRDGILLFHHGDELRCRVAGRLEIDGAVWRGEGPIQRNSHVAGSDFSLSLETL
jgi:hypothetical protein